MARLRWKAFYYDGKTALRHDVEVTLSPESLEVAGESVAASWRYDDVTQTQGGNIGEPVRLEKGEEAVIVSEEGFLNSLNEVAPSYRSRFHRPAKAGKNLLLIITAFLLTVSIGTCVYLWGIPRVSAYAAEKVPLSVEERLGKTFVGGLMDAMPECASPEANKSVQEILKRLESAAPPNPYKFRVYVLDSEVENAFATPGGYIVVFSGLIEKTESPEELAGVLAHEMQHVLKKHVTKGIFQDLSTGMLIAFVLGDFQGASRAAQTIGNLRYSRITEDEADRLGAELLIKADIDPKGFSDFFDRLGGKSDIGFVKYLSTHPAPHERAEQIRKIAGGLKEKSVPLLPGTDWKKVRTSCECVCRGLGD